eukprot:TRINITY_DN8638_c0_g1_i2.p1 TRINITY_DN8638_c0_g1~~TRINITY_DN8638_c0_g1_i2.p1  ORF type:complete len:372 (+),score=73.98 TRINITY_DN8638_c0_g1_i2:456-1571(+)
MRNHDGCVDLQEFLDGITEAVQKMNWLDIDNVLSLLQDGLGDRLDSSKEDTDLNELQQHQLRASSVATYTLPTELAHKFKLHSVLGKGAFGKVFSAEDTSTGNMVAFKVVNLPPENGQFLREMTLAEAKLMQRLDHKRVLACLGVSEMENQVWIALDCMHGGDLRDLITEYGKLEESASRGIMQQILNALSYLHDEVKIVHRDLKPLNVLLRTPITGPNQVPDLVLSDFGLSTEFKSTKVLKMLCGTPHYLAPEIVRSEGYTRSVDLWASGVILYELHCGRQPFLGHTQDEVFEAIMEAELDFSAKVWQTASSSLIDLLRCLLDRKPLRRCSCLEALSHPWMDGARSSEARERNVMELLADFGSDEDSSYE